MSADKHCGIRRQKQKRAKDTKKQARRRRPHDVATSPSAAAPPVPAG